jgi:hypothetical protein
MTDAVMWRCNRCKGEFGGDDVTVWVMKGIPYHPECIRKNRDLLDEWRACENEDKEIL